MPGVHGGVERHCEELYPRLASLGVDVTVYARRGYVDSDQEFAGVRVKVIGAPRVRGAEALTHTARAIVRACRDGADILHVHSVGPASLIPLARALGERRIVSTLHAPDYLQVKWGAVARRILRFGERTAVMRSDEVIAVSRWYGDALSGDYNRTPVVIPNGPGLMGTVPRTPSPILTKLGVAPGEYFLFVGRFVRDKRVEDLIAAHARICDGSKVIIAGDSGDSDAYAAWVRSMAGDRVIFPGYVYGPDLADLYANARAFVLPSAVEGLPISALEAMRFATPAVLSDIPANREVADDGLAAILFPCGDVDALALALERTAGDTEALVSRASGRVARTYDWDVIAQNTLEVYEAVMRLRAGR